MGGMGGIAGIDMGPVFKMAESLGYDTFAITELFPAAEAGLVKALNDRSDGVDD